MKRTVEERFWEKVDRSGRCWLWTGVLASNGYGQFWLNGRMQQAHRVAYELVIGPIPDGLHIDHVRVRGCTRPDCVNPDHLEPVTPKINTHRAPNAPATINAAKTHCDSGHLLSGENLRVWVDKSGSAHRHCRECSKLRQRLYRAATCST